MFAVYWRQTVGSSRKAITDNGQHSKNMHLLELLMQI